MQERTTQDATVFTGSNPSQSFREKEDAQRTRSSPICSSCLLAPVASEKGKRRRIEVKHSKPPAPVTSVLGRTPAAPAWIPYVQQPSVVVHLRRQFRASPGPSTSPAPPRATPRFSERALDASAYSRDAMAEISPGVSLAASPV